MNLEQTQAYNPEVIFMTEETNDKVEELAKRTGPKRVTERPEKCKPPAIDSTVEEKLVGGNLRFVVYHLQKPVK